jgi:hypothetical protein
LAGLALRCPDECLGYWNPAVREELGWEFFAASAAP